MFKRIMNRKETPVVIATIVLIIVISLSNSIFLRSDNISDLMKTNAILAICVFGLTPVLISGGIDVSIGSAIGACTCVCGALISKEYALAVPVAIAVTLITGIVIGLINGALIVYLNITPIVATLATQTMLKGITMLVTNGTWIPIRNQKVLDFGLIRFFSTEVENGSLNGIPVQMIFVVAFAILTALILKRTSVGRGVYAIGGNEVSAKRAGFHSDAIKMGVYGFMGFACGLVAFLHSCNMRQIDPNTYSGYELDVIAAAYLGGASNGEGSIFGAVFGVILICVLKNGLTLMKISSYWHNIIIGLIIVLSVSLDAIQRTRRELSRTRVDVDMD